jgi:type II secretory pathway pseudopilin PulG
MGAAMRHRKTDRKRRTSRGFALVEVMIAMVVMTIAILAVLASLGTALAATESAQEDLIARHKALEAMESIYTARNSLQIPFSSINNTFAGGIFLSGPQPLLCAGADGLVGTTNVVPCLTTAGALCPNGGVECQVLPGPDGVLGTADDVTMSLANFTRTIAFNPVFLPLALGGGINQNMIAVTITVSYYKPGMSAVAPRTYTVNGLITSYR